jgi:hypothetical protein
MDQDTAALISQLCTRAGMIMEEVVDSALTISHAEPAERTKHLHNLKHATDRINKLINAAMALDG